MSTALIVALFAVMALRPPMPRHSSPFNLQFALGWWINEMPFLGLWWLLAGTMGTLIQPQSGALVVAGRRFGRGGHAAAGADRGTRPIRPSGAVGGVSRRLRVPWSSPVHPTGLVADHAVPIISWRPDVRRIRNLRYGPARRGNRLDVYVSRRHRRTGAPVLVYFHGSFRWATRWSAPAR